MKPLLYIYLLIYNVKSSALKSHQNLNNSEIPASFRYKIISKFSHQKADAYLFWNNFFTVKNNFKSNKIYLSFHIKINVFSLKICSYKNHQISIHCCIKLLSYKKEI